MISPRFSRRAQSCDSAVRAADKQEIVIAAMKEEHLGMKEAVSALAARPDGMKFQRQLADGGNRKCG